jgi:5-hydroxyisourate hydrolase-like protein (transthyretin family)
MQYAHSPQYHGAVLSQQQYLQADTNHDGRVSQAEIQYAMSAASPYGAAPVAYAPAAASVQGYEQYMQYAHSPQYHGAVLSQQQYLQADTNHDGRVSQAEIQYAMPAASPYGVPAGQQPAQAAFPTASSMIAYPVQSYMPQYEQYQIQNSGYPQLTVQQFAQADTNHDGKVSKQEIAAEVVKGSPTSALAAPKASKSKKASKKKKKGGCC